MHRLQPIFVCGEVACDVGSRGGSRASRVKPSEQGYLCKAYQGERIVRELGEGVNDLGIVENACVLASVSWGCRGNPSRVDGRWKEEDRKKSLEDLRKVGLSNYGYYYNSLLLALALDLPGLAC